MEKITIKEARTRAGLSLRQFVAKSKETGKGISVKTLHFIETGKRKTIHPKTKNTIAKVLEMDLDLLEFTTK